LKTTQASFPAYVFLFLGTIIPTFAQQEPLPDVPVIHVTSNLVYLDITVLDSNGRPVVKGLTKDDFTITENKKPQRIFSFEAPEEHISPGDADAENPTGKAPTSIFVLDVLNEPPPDVYYYRFELERYLKTLPEQLAAPAEFLVVGNETLELFQGYTRSRDELIAALHRVPATFPYKLNGAFGSERFVQSVDAIQQIVVQNKGIPGRKNIFWLGEGSPTINPAFLTGKGVDTLKVFIHETANMLVEDRITLFVFHPGLKARVTSIGAIPGVFNYEGNPLDSNVDFGALVNETGGTVYYNRNDIDHALAGAEKRGSQFYTLTYQPSDGVQDGKFRSIHINMRDASMHALTKAGYFDPSKDESEDPQRKGIHNLGEAARATIPLNGLDLKIARVLRHPDAQTVEVSILIPASKLQWQPADPGTSRTSVRVAVVGFSKNSRPVVWKVEQLGLKTGTDDPQKLAKGILPVMVTVGLPQKLQNMRIMLEPSADSQIGALNLSRREIDAAPEQATPPPPAAPASLVPKNPVASPTP
jgi:VWFA-related protein